MGCVTPTLAGVEADCKTAGAILATSLDVRPFDCLKCSDEFLLNSEYRFFSVHSTAAWSPPSNTPNNIQYSLVNQPLLPRVDRS